MKYTQQVESIFAPRPNDRMPLVQRGSIEIDIAAVPAVELFPGSRSPKGAKAGLLLYLGGWRQAHEISQDLETAEGMYWHGIVHRQEPDPGNAAYWFRRLGKHPIFAALQQDALAIAAAHPETRLALPAAWDPITFIDICEGGGEAAVEIQHAEWKRLFEWCAEAG